MKLRNATKKTREIILNEIVATLEFIDYLKYEAVGSVRNIIRRQQAKKKRLVTALQVAQ